MSDLRATEYKYRIRVEAGLGDAGVMDIYITTYPGSNDPTIAVRTIPGARIKDLDGKYSSLVAVLAVVKGLVDALPS